jgi:hypothetical protein
VLPEERLRRIEDALRARFPDVRRTLTRRCTVFDARMSPDPASPTSGHGESAIP